MLKVKEWLEEKGITAMPSTILRGIEATGIKVLTIHLTTGLTFTIEQTSKDIPTNCFISFDHVFVDGMYYKEFITINTEHIVCYYA